ncbi:hypothetical protein BH23THE1_BH23THE1_30590 [soil metagenome]
MHSHFKFTKSFYLFVLLPVILVSGFYTTNTIFTDASFSLLNIVDAQILPQYNPIEILSTSSYIDDFGNFHIVGEVNNTSFQPQINVIAGALLYNLTTNELVGNYSAFTSLEILRSGELSPFHIVVDDPQLLGNFDFIEFITSSQEGQAKPSNLVLNVTNRYVEQAGNPHIAGNIVNQGNFPEQFANLIATYYDNSSQGVIGTETFGLDLGNISQGQLTWFDLEIADNRTKNQAQFFTLSVESNQSSMDYPINIKRPILTTNDPFGSSAMSSLFSDPLQGSSQAFSNNDNIDNNIGQSFSPSSNSGSGSGSTNNDVSSTSDNRDLDIEVDIEENPLVRGNDQTIDATVSDSDTGEVIEGAEVETRVLYASKATVEVHNDQTDNEGEYSYTWEVGPNSDPGNFEVTITADAEGYNQETEEANFEAIKDDVEQINNTPINTTDVENEGITTENENSRCDDGFHRSPSGDCERVTDTSGMPRCDDGFHRSPDGDCERVTDNSNDEGNGDEGNGDEGEEN